MKKLLKYFVLLILILPFTVNAAEKIEVIDAKLDDISEYAEGFPEFPTVNGLTLNINGKFNSLYAQYANYSFKIKNNDTVDYELSCSNRDSNTEDGYYDCTLKEGEVVNYYLSCEHTILKAGTTTNCQLNISVRETIDRSILDNNTYEANDQLTIPLNTNKMTLVDKAKQLVTNPKTSSKYLVIGLIVISIVAGTIVFIRGNRKVKTMVLLLGIMMLPLEALAIATIIINVNSNIILEARERFMYVDNDGNLSEHEFTYGETWNEYLASNKNTSFGAIGNLPIPNAIVYRPFYECIMSGGDEDTCKESCRDYGDFEVYEPIHGDDEITGYRGDYVMDWYYTFLDGLQNNEIPEDPNLAPGV